MLTLSPGRCPYHLRPPGCGDSRTLLRWPQCSSAGEGPPSQLADLLLLTPNLQQRSWKRFVSPLWEPSHMHRELHVRIPGGRVAQFPLCAAQPEKCTRSLSLSTLTIVPPRQQHRGQLRVPSPLCLSLQGNLNQKAMKVELCGASVSSSITPWLRFSSACVRAVLHTGETGRSVRCMSLCFNQQHELLYHHDFHIFFLGSKY